VPSPTNAADCGNGRVGGETRRTAAAAVLIHGEHYSVLVKNGTREILGVVQRMWSNEIWHDHTFIEADVPTVTRGRRDRTF
jgi:hypothetical protein